MRPLSAVSVLLALCLLCACAAPTIQVPQTEPVLPALESDSPAQSLPAQTEPAGQTPDAASDTAAAPETELQETAPVSVTEPAPDTEPVPETEPLTGPLICIDPGHQRLANTDTEPLGPGSTEMKMKVSGGTAGVNTRLPEYELVLSVSFLLRDILQARGYRVLLTHDTPDVDLSNAQRAAIANEAGADAFLRIHANGVQDSTRHGAMTICMTKNNPYNAWLYDDSYRLSALVLDAMCAASGAAPEYVWQTDSMTGINYAQVPVTIVEMGYQSNPEEDALLATPEYQRLLAQGIADGIDAYFAGVQPD